MLLRAKTIKVWGWIPLLLLGDRDRSPNASTPVTTIAKILTAVEGRAMAVHPEERNDDPTTSQAEGGLEPTRRRRRDR